MSKATLLSILFLCSCSSHTKLEKPLIINSDFSNEETARESKAVYQSLSGDERDTLVSNYLHLYRYSLTQPCNLPFDETPLAEIPVLKLPNVQFHSIFPDQPVIGAADLTQTASTTTTMLKLDEEQRIALQIMQKVPVGNLNALSGLLIRAGNQKKIRYLLCRRTGENAGICTEDVLIGKLVDVSNLPTFCDWIKDKKTVVKVQTSKNAVEILNMLKRLKLLSPAALSMN